MTTLDVDGFLGGEIEAWTKAHIDRYGGFAVCSRINREVHRFITTLASNRWNCNRHLVSLVLLIRTLQLFQALLIVLQHGMVAPARALHRVFIEAGFTLRAIQADEETFKLYLQQLHVAKKKTINRLLSSSSPVLAGLKGTVSQQQVGEIERLLADQSIRELSAEELSRKSDMHEVYLTAYTVLSGAVHTTAHDLKDDLTYEQERISGSNYGPREDQTARTLQTAGLTMIDLLSRTARFLGRDADETCNSLIHQLVGIYPLPETEENRTRP